MKYKRILLTFSFLLIFAFLGVLIAKYKFKIVPSEQINVELMNVSKGRPKIASIHIVNFTTLGGSPWKEMTPRYRFQKGQLMWILINYTMGWENMPALTGENVNTKYCSGMELNRSEFYLIDQEIQRYKALSYVDISIDMIGPHGERIPNWDFQRGTPAFSIVHLIYEPMLGYPVWKEPPPSNRSFYFHLIAGNIPTFWAEGNYTLILRIREMFTGADLRKETKFEVLPGISNELFPMPINESARDLILEQDDLPGGWMLTWESSKNYISYGPVDEIRRVFEKDDKGLKTRITIILYRFNNPGYAKDFYLSWKRSRAEQRIEWFAKECSGEISWESRDSEVRIGNYTIPAPFCLTEYDELGEMAFFVNRSCKIALEYLSILEGEESELCMGRTTIEDIEWIRGSEITFVKENIVICIFLDCNVESLNEGFEPSPDLLLEIAKIQANKTSKTP